jgi:hypothetical protein
MSRVQREASGGFEDRQCSPQRAFEEPMQPMRQRLVAARRQAGDVEWDKR